MNIEELDLDIKAYNRLKKNLPDVCTVNHLIAEMYDEHGVDKVSAPDMKAIEKALKDKGIFKYMRGDEVSEDDIEPTPLTWDELHDYVGKLVVCDDSTQSHRWLHLCWIYSIKDDGPTSLMYICRGNAFSNARRSGVEDSNTKTVALYGSNLLHEGHFFALKDGVLRLDHRNGFGTDYGKEYNGETDRAHFGKELTFDELTALPEGTKVLVFDEADETDDDDDIDAVLYETEAQFEGFPFKVCRTDENDVLDEMVISPTSMIPSQNYLYTRVWMFNDTAQPIEQEAPAEIVPQITAQVAVQYVRAVVLTRSIIANAQAAQQSLLEMCKGLAEMRDAKLYKEIGYGTFEDYCEQEIGITRRQGQKYAAIASLDGKSTSDFERVGVEKLYLLAKIDDEQREQITETVDVESVTVRELKAQIDALKHQNDQTEAALQDAEERAQRWCDNAEERRQRIDELGGKVDKQKMEVEKLNAEVANNNRYIQQLQEQNRGKDTDIEQLQARITELESRPVEVAVQSDTAELEKLRAEYEERLAEAKKDAEYREVMAMCKLARDQVNTLCTRLRGIRSGKEKDSLLKYIKEIGLLIGQLI